MTGRARIWMPLPDEDFEPSEAAVPWWVLTRAGHEVVIATERGAAGPTPACDRRLLTGVVFGQLGATPRAKALYERMRESDEMRSPVAWGDIDPASFDGLVLPGGHAPGMKQYLDSEALRRKVAAFWALGRPVGAICHGVLVLARTTDPSTGRSVIASKRTTCLPKYLELGAWALTAWKVGSYYRTYRTTVEDEVKAALDDPRQFELGPFLFAPPGTALDERTAFVVEDGHYLSARWPGDAARFAQRVRAAVDARRPSVSLESRASEPAR